MALTGVATAGIPATVPRPRGIARVHCGVRNVQCGPRRRTGARVAPVGPRRSACAYFTPSTRRASKYSPVARRTHRSSLRAGLRPVRPTGEARRSMVRFLVRRLLQLRRALPDRDVPRLHPRVADLRPAGRAARAQPTAAGGGDRGQARRAAPRRADPAAVRGLDRRRGAAATSARPSPACRSPTSSVAGSGVSLRLFLLGTMIGVVARRAASAWPARSASTSSATTLATVFSFVLLSTPVFVLGRAAQVRRRCRSTRRRARPSCTSPGETTPGFQGSCCGRAASTGCSTSSCRRSRSRWARSPSTAATSAARCSTCWAATSCAPRRPRA